MHTSKNGESFDDVRLFIWLHTAHQRPFQFGSTLEQYEAFTNQNEEMDQPGDAQQPHQGASWAYERCEGATVAEML